MNKNTETITMLQASMILMSTAGIMDHVIVIPMLLQTAGRDAWVSVLFTAVLYIMWIFFIYAMVKRTRQQHLIVWLKSRYGNLITWMIGAIVVIQLFAMSLITLFDTTYWTKISYLPKTPHLILVLVFSFLSFYLAHSGIRAIGIVNGILLPIVIMFGFFVAISNFPNKDYSLLFPVMEHGWSPVWKGMIYTGSGLVEMFLVVFMQQRIETAIRPKPLLVTGLIFVVLILGPLTGAIAEFGPVEAARQRFPAYEEWRLITYGHFFEHLDFLSIYQWLVGAFMRISIAMFLIPEVMNLAAGKKRTWTLIALFAAMAVITQVMPGDIHFFRILKKFFLPYTLLLAITLSLILGILLFSKREQSGVKQ